MFRGVGVTVFRVNGFSEARVALWSSVVFGAVHLTNALSTGGTAVAQAIAVSFAGGLAAIVAYPVVAVVLLVRRHRIEPSG